MNAWGVDTRIPVLEDDPFNEAALLDPCPFCLRTRTRGSIFRVETRPGAGREKGLPVEQAPPARTRSRRPMHQVMPAGRLLATEQTITRATERLQTAVSECQTR